MPDPTQEQKAILDAIPTTPPGHNIVVIAGPGSGKTKTLIDAVVLAVNGGTAPERIRITTFTNNTAAELFVRLAGLGDPRLRQIQVGTLHSWAQQLAEETIDPRTYAPLLLKKLPLAVALRLFDRKKQPLGGIWVEAAERILEGSESVEQMEARNLPAEIAEQKKLSVTDCRDAFERLKACLDQLRLELARTELLTHGTIMKNGTAHALRQEAPLDWVFVDEAQDINQPQEDFLRAVQTRTQCRLFVIGDDDQGIYKFRGGNDRFLRALAQDPHSRLCRLTRNFRSTNQIVDFSRGWIGANWALFGNEPKTLNSDRGNGTPVVLLAADNPVDRGRHAAIILSKYIASAANGATPVPWGQVALFSQSTKIFKPDEDERSHFLAEIAKQGIQPHICEHEVLGKDIRQHFVELMERYQTDQPAWHHDYWHAFLDDPQFELRKNGGLPALGDLFAVVEVLRRLVPYLPPGAAAKVLADVFTYRTKDWKGASHPPDFLGEGERPDPDYAGAGPNLLTLHGSKGLEFRAAWLAGIGPLFERLSSNQPNSQMTLDEYAAQGRVLTNEELENAEKRRLIYVGMTRPTDLLLLSVPGFTPTPKKGAPQSSIGRILAAIGHVLTSRKRETDYWIIDTDQAAKQFPGKAGWVYHPKWQPPHRYEIESFTSLTRQPIPGEDRIVEIPRKKELPLPQNEGALTGDLFHRVMHLLCTEPDTLAQRLAGALTDAALVARVSTQARPQVEALLARFFADTTHQPWTWFAGARSEIRFNHVDKKTDVSPILIKGFVDLVQYDAQGAILHIVDWKTDEPDSPDAQPGGRHEQQLQLYARALAPTQTPPPELLNYYVRAPQARVRPALPPEVRLPFLDQPTAAIPAPASAPSPRSQAQSSSPQDQPTPVTPRTTGVQGANSSVPSSTFPVQSSSAPRPAPDPRIAAQTLLDRCRPHCRRRANGQTSAKVDDLARALGLTTTAFLSQLAPLALRELPQREITAQTRPPFIGVANNHSRWLNL